MIRNMGILDRGIRFAVALLIGLLYGMGELSGTAATVLGVLALLLVATSFVGTCPLYLPFGLDTRIKDTAPSRRKGRR